MDTDPLHTCTTKQRFASKAEARKTIDKMRRNGANGRLNAYVCPFDLRHVHIGHEPATKTRAKRNRQYAHRAAGWAA